MDRWTVQSLADFRFEYFASDDDNNVDNGAAATTDDGDSECDDNDVFWSEAWLFHKHSGALIVFNILLEMATTQKDDGDNDEKPGRSTDTETEWRVPRIKDCPWIYTPLDSPLLHNITLQQRSYKYHKYICEYKYWAYQKERNIRSLSSFTMGNYASLRIKYINKNNLGLFR